MMKLKKMTLALSLVAALLVPAAPAMAEAEGEIEIVVYPDGSTETVSTGVDTITYPDPTGGGVTAVPISV